MFKSSLMFQKWILAVALMAAVVFSAQGAQHIVESQVFLLRSELPSNATLFAVLKTDWQITPTNTSSTANSLLFKVPSGQIECTLEKTPVAESDWSAFASIAWLWKGAASEIKGHKAHLRVKFTADAAVSVYQAELDLARIQSSIIQSLPNNAIGVLMSDRYLLLDASLYKETMRNLPEGEVPAYLMVYFGMANENKKSSGFTYGLHKFNLPEVEIVNSDRTVHEVHGVLVQSVSNLLANGNLSTNTGSKSNAAVVSVSEGVFVQGQTMKLKL
jgi:hypothetical protein